MMSCDLNAADYILGKKVLGGSKALDMSDILIYKGVLEKFAGEKKKGRGRKETLKLCKSHLLMVEVDPG